MAKYHLPGPTPTAYTSTTAFTSRSPQQVRAVVFCVPDVEPLTSPVEPLMTPSVCASSNAYYIYTFNFQTTCVGTAYGKSVSRVLTFQAVCSAPSGGTASVTARQVKYGTVLYRT